jgi:hypothetical protein
VSNYLTQKEEKMNYPYQPYQYGSTNSEYTRDDTASMIIVQARYNEMRKQFERKQAVKAWFKNLFTGKA